MKPKLFNSKKTLSALVVLCAGSTMVLSHSARAECPAWNAKVSYMPSANTPTLNYPVRYLDGKVYVARWYTIPGQAPNSRHADDAFNPWAPAGPEVCSHIPPPGTANIAWMKSKYLSGEATFLHWDMWEGNPSLHWQILDTTGNITEKMIYSSATIGAKGSQASGDVTIKLPDGIHALSVKLCTNDSCHIGPLVIITVGDTHF
jgi:hypothetical protein